MVGEYETQGYGDRFFVDLNTRIRDLEEKQRLLKERMQLLSESFVKERKKNFEEIQEMKKVIERLNLENQRFREILLRFGEGIDKAARKEELMILQRQFDMFRRD